jgi:hypothetical protein
MGRHHGGIMKAQSVIIGHDPGGNNCHGVARVLAKGDRATSVETMTLATTEDVIRLLEQQRSLDALGVDTPLVLVHRTQWLAAGRPVAAEALPGGPQQRRQPQCAFRLHGLNGMGVVLSARQGYSGALITETHPKVLYHLMTALRYDYSANGDAMDRALVGAPGVPVPSRNDHEWDAALSAYAVRGSISGCQGALSEQLRAARSHSRERSPTIIGSGPPSGVRLSRRKGLHDGSSDSKLERAEPHAIAG